MSDGAFLGYCLLLVLSGVLLAVLAIGGFGQSKLSRIFLGLGGALFLGYAFYLLFFFTGDEVRVFLYAFIVPILAVIQVVKAAKARRETAAEPAFQQPGPYAPEQSNYRAGPAQPGTYGAVPAQPGAYGAGPAQPNTHGAVAAESGTYGGAPAQPGTYGGTPPHAGTYGTAPGQPGVYGTPSQGAPAPGYQQGGFPPQR